MKAASLMHSEAQWTVLNLISEGEFHLVAVLLHGRASLNSFEYIITAHRLEKLLNLLFLYIKLLLISYRLIYAAAAPAEMSASDALIHKR